MILPLLLLCFISQVTSFNPSNIHSNFRVKIILHGKKSSSSSNSGKGFGKTARSTIKVRQTYGKTQIPKDELIDVEGAMEEFFRTNEEWHPLFASFATSNDVPAMDFLPSTIEIGTELSFEDGQPWQELTTAPNGDNKEELMGVIAKVLDASQQALIDIPVNEASKEDGDDLHFLEEGRRILCLKRFQVLTYEESAIDRHEKMFQTCWSELMYLVNAKEEDSGSLIILPDSYDISDVKRFTDMNIRRPLEWLGIDSSVIEVASLQRESPCIRLLYKLSDMPSLEARDSRLQSEE